MRTILHSDLNNFYASVELLKHPEYKDMPVAVCGNKEDRHGIVLAKNQIAKSFGVSTGEVIWSAKKKCKNLVTFPADFPAYLRVSKAVRDIYARYTDKIESFGIDECWLDVTESIKLFGTGEEIAEKIRTEIKTEIGVTVSIGVSFNKVFAKLGSDMKKPDAITVISPENYKQLVWRLPVSDLLYVGKATEKKLCSIGVHTIGDVANCNEKVLVNLLGVWGKNLYTYACGLDDSPVMDKRAEEGAKSISNSLTNYRDAISRDEVFTLILLLAESVAGRLRESGLGKAETVRLGITDSELNGYGRQMKLSMPTSSAQTIANACYELFDKFYNWSNPVRGVTVGVSGFTHGVEQLGFGLENEREKKEDKLDKTIDQIRRKYGNNSVQRATILKDSRLAQTDIKGEHLIHPAGVKDLPSDL